jgi:hypothetical protein
MSGSGAPARHGTRSRVRRCGLHGFSPSSVLDLTFEDHELLVLDGDAGDGLVRGLVLVAAGEGV